MALIQELISYIIVIILLSDLWLVYDACHPNLPQQRTRAVFGRHDCEGNMRSPVCPSGPSVSEWCNGAVQRSESAFNLESLSLNCRTFRKITAERNNLIRVCCAWHYLSVVGEWLHNSVTVPAQKLSTVGKMGESSQQSCLVGTEFKLPSFSHPALLIDSVLFVWDLLKQCKWPFT